jgi:hypothetical protein
VRVRHVEGAAEIALRDVVPAVELPIRSRAANVKSRRVRSYLTCVVEKSWWPAIPPYSLMV